MSSRFHSLSDQ